MSFADDFKEVSDYQEGNPNDNPVSFAHEGLRYSGKIEGQKGNMLQLSDVSVHGLDGETQGSFSSFYVNLDVVIGLGFS
jgi:hypothetical protein